MSHLSQVQDIFGLSILVESEVIATFDHLVQHHAASVEELSARLVLIAVEVVADRSSLAMRLCVLAGVLHLQMLRRHRLQIVAHLARRPSFQCLNRVVPAAESCRELFLRRNLLPELVFEQQSGDYCFAADCVELIVQCQGE
jgi:hypothetical protein